MTMGMRVLITGCSGFVGSHLSRYLLRDGYDVVGIDLVEARVGAEFRRCDVTRKPDLDRVFSEAQPEFVVHLAALCSARESNADPYPTFLVNTLGTLNVAECCSRHGARMLLMSSAAVLGPTPPEVPVTEENWVYDPRSGYAYSKVAAEQVFWQYVRNKGLEGVLFRSWNLVGEGCRGTIVSLLASLAVEGRPITLYCFGRQVMDVNYVGNLCEAVRLVIDGGEGAGEMFHIGSGRPVTLKWVVERLIEHSRSASKVVLAPPRKGEVPIRSYPSIEKARRVLGYNPAVAVEEAIRRTIGGDDAGGHGDLAQETAGGGDEDMG